MAANSALVNLSNGVKMPLLGFGTFRLNGAETVLKSLDSAVSVGYRLIDTAAMYKNEKEIGNALKILLPKHKLSRADLFITTKHLHTGKNATEETRQSLENSLAELQIDYVDLFLLHYPKARSLENDDPENKNLRREVWKEMERAYDEGLVKAIGVSNFEVKHLEEMKSYARIAPAVNQCEFHPHFVRTELRSYCRANNVHFQAYTSLGRNNAELFDEPLLRELASKYAVSVAQILLAIPLSLGISAIPKSASPARIQENFDAGKIRMADSDVEVTLALDKNKPYTLSTPWLVC